MPLIHITFILICIYILNTCDSTPLDDYVNTPDPTFSWKRLQTYPKGTYTVHVLNMTSQKWMDGKVILLKNKLCKVMMDRFIFIKFNLVA
jgi:hypothetical protein